MAEERVRVLLLDDEASLRVPLQRFLESRFGYQVDTAASGEEALDLVARAEGHYDVALIDEVLMPGPDGIEVMERIKARYPDIECIRLWCTNLDNWAGLRYNDYYEEEKTFPTPATKTAKAEKEDPEDPLPGEKLAGIRPGSGPTGRSDPLDYR